MYGSSCRSLSHGLKKFGSIRVFSIQGLQTCGRPSDFFQTGNYRDLASLIDTIPIHGVRGFVPYLLYRRKLNT